MTPQEHRQQRDMVIKSLMLAPTKTERGEERPRKHVKRLAPPVFAPAPNAHEFRFPTVRPL